MGPDVPVSPRAAERLPDYNAGAHLQPAKNTVAVLPQKCPALVITTSTDKYFRVQVGPYADTQPATNARHDLEAKGFKSIVKR
jgi:cell division protein FtsN